VVLATTFLDSRVRLGKGSRGSLFVFTRTEEGTASLQDAGACSSPRKPPCACALQGLQERCSDCVGHQAVEEEI
jgi:hypothetical protein